MKDNHLIDNFLIQLQESGCFTALDLVELEDHLKQETAFQSNYFDEVTAQQKAIQLIGESEQLIRSYYKKNFRILFETYLFYFFSGASFLIFLHGIFLSSLVIMLSLFEPVAGTALFSFFEYLPFMIILLVSIGLFQWVSHLNWSLDGFFKNNCFLRKLRWAIPVVMLMMIPVTVFLGSSAIGGGRVDVLSHMGQSLIFGPILWLIAAIISLFKKKGEKILSRKQANLRFSFFLGAFSYICFGHLVGNLIVILKPILHPLIGLLIFYLGLITTFLWLIVRRKRLLEQVFNIH